MPKDLKRMNPKKPMTAMKKAMYFAIIAAVILIFTGGAIWYSASRVYGHKTVDQQLGELGSYGSYLQGTVGSLWSLATLCVVLAAFLAQNEQVLQQRKELDEERKSRFQQNFESTFFQLLNLQMEIVAGMNVINSQYGAVRGTKAQTNEQSYSGRACFKFLYDEFSQCSAPSRLVKTLKTNMPTSALAEIPDQEFMVGQYLKFYESYQSIVGHYFRNLYHVFKFVSESDIQDKERYANWIIAELSVYELALLFYNAITPIPPETKNKFKSLIEEFAVFKNLDCKRILIDDDHRTFYAPTAFARNDK